MQTIAKRKFVCARNQYLKLKVNARSITQEQRIIRSYERQSLSKGRESKSDEQRQEHYQAFFELEEHRRGRLRDIARVAHLTLAYVNGKKYKQCEPSTREYPYMLTRELQAKWDKFKIEGDAQQWLTAK